MRVRPLVVVAAAAIVGAGWLAPAAVADYNHFVLDAGHVTRVHLNGSDGYRIGFSSNARRYFTLKTRKGGALTRYGVRGRPSGEDEIKARLRGIGRVEVSFVPRGRERQLAPYSNCDGPGPTLQKGVVRGEIRFVGERGYTRVAAKRASAEVLSWTRQRCRYRTQGRQRGPRKRTMSFFAFAPRPTYVEFTASRFSAEARPPRRQIAFTANTVSERGPVWISRSVSVASDLSSLRLPEGVAVPEHVVFTPPAPFSGSGTFVRTPESTFAWEGSLSVEFPGTGPFSLAGPGFGTRLCALRGCVSQYDER